VRSCLGIDYVLLHGVRTAEERHDRQAVCCLCGNSDMIYEVFAILRGQGVPRSRISAEIYF
jgi:hypothetical protein